jgi:hypothetical protein
MVLGGKVARRPVAGQRQDAHDARAVDVLPLAPALGVATHARILRIAVENAIRSLGALVADGLAVEVTHRAKRRLFGLACSVWRRSGGAAPALSITPILTAGAAGPATEGIIDALKLPDPDDRHVQPAAIIGKADVIVTANLKDFPAAALAPFKIEAQHPDAFIAHALMLALPIALAAIKEIRARLQKPPFSPDEFVSVVARHGLPRTVAILREHVSLI